MKIVLMREKEKSFQDILLVSGLSECHPITFYTALKKMLASEQDTLVLF